MPENANFTLLFLGVFGKIKVSENKKRDELGAHLITE